VDGSWSFEIDSMECVDPTGRHIAEHLHANNGAIDFTSNPGLGLDMAQDMTADFHTYAIDWQPGSLKWLIDGKVTQQTTSNVPNVSIFLIMNLAVGGNWPGDPIAATKFPPEMIVDYVKVWQR
jgi:beta-glucanase (GH16 family)